ncbi:hypothetical protein [Streptomyces formicae]|uniref:MmpS family membrane protein n=1 Tax=Streptomyces formicae TaxID=1616117 RepID=A0A291QEX2_9ACTN|nr:hypothetical protein [Streptomyces formicae]ATL29985.1 hypothetical protein KY5_4967c [Streptomyces formicae]
MKKEIAAEAGKDFGTVAGIEETGETVVPESEVEGEVVGEISDRRVVSVGAALFALCAAFIVYGALDEDEPERRRPAPTASVTYRVTGTGEAGISYVAGGAKGDATVEDGVDLPWHKTVRVPLGEDPAVSIRLGKEGGEASCVLAIGGEHRRRATASGAYGRATCTADLPAKRN